MIRVSVPLFRLILILASFASGACERPAHDANSPARRSATQYPHAADRFIQLVRKQLTAPNPAAVEQEIMCEGERMSRALGDAETSIRIRSALDTAYPRRSDSLAFQRVGRALEGHVLGTGDHVCDSLIAAADSVEPIVPVRQPERP